MALLASCDLYHRLTQNVPTGYEHDYAPRFELANEIKIFSHEWPFSVSYCTALCELSKKQPAPVQFALETVKRLLNNVNLPDNGEKVVPSSLWNKHKSCFVSIKTKSRELRGCIGTLSAIYEALVKDIGAKYFCLILKVLKQQNSRFRLQR